MIRLSYLFFQTDANFFRESIRNLFFGLKKKKKEEWCKFVWLSV